MVFKAVLFDLDNTLINFMKFKHACIDASIKGMQKAGLKMTQKQAKKKILEAYAGFHEDPLVFQKFLKKEFGFVDYKLLAAAIVAYRKTRPKVMRTYLGVIPTLKKLKQMGLKLGIVSDAPKIKAWLRLTYVGITDFFDIILTSDDFKEKKPAPDGFKMAMDLLDVKAKETIFVGDNPEKDILGANKVGMTSVFGRYGLKPRGNGLKKPDYVIDNIKELLSILEQQK